MLPSTVPVPPPQFAWLDGRLVPFDECVIHVRAQGAFWGANVFEGLRGYWSAPAGHISVFRIEDHLRRLAGSMKSLNMPSVYSANELTAACVEVLQANAFTEDVHICVVAYFGQGPNYDPLAYTDATGAHITATRMPRSNGFERGIAVSIASWRRISDDSMPPRIKTGANYHNSRLAHHEACRNGFDTALLLNHRGTVSEAPGSCVVMLRAGRLVSPPGTSGVLEGITLATVDDLGREHLGLEIERREIDRTEFYTADEAFLCGTLAEILPIVSVDRVPIGDGVLGPITRSLQGLYDTAVRGGSPYPRWSLPVPVGPAVQAAPAAPVGPAVQTIPAVQVASAEQVGPAVQAAPA